MLGLRFGPDEHHYAYLPGVDKGWMVVVDGEIGRIYEEIGLSEEFISPNVISYVAFDGDETLLVEEAIGQ